MDLIIELKIKNLSDWAIIQPLLKRLKISFVQKPIQKEVEQNQMASEPQGASGKLTKSCKNTS